MFDNFNNLLLFVEQHIEQVREAFQGRESWRLETFAQICLLFHAQFELGPLGCILLTISAVLSRSIERYDRPCHRCDIRAPPSGDPSAVFALCSVESERIWMCPLPRWSEPTATALRCDTSAVNWYVTLYVCCNIFFPLVSCLQELVNLLVCGRAVPNVFDNDIELDSGKGNVTLLKGIKSNCDVGLLSLFEHYNICKVRTELWEVPRGGVLQK